MAWLTKGVISFAKSKGQGVFAREKTLIRLSPAYVPGAGLESELYTIFQEACADGLQTDNRELARLMSKKRAQLARWPLEVEQASRQYLAENGFIYSTAKKMVLTGLGEELNGRLFMFANFLRDFALTEDQAAYSVQALDQLMVWASLLGFSDSFSRHYQELFPAYFSRSVHTAETLAQARAISSSIATAGSSSSSTGGGGGSFGGGSGGGTR